jgi:hypothetical protein
MKGQTSYEFLIIYASLLMVFLIIFLVYFDGSLNLFQRQAKTNTLRNAEAIAAAINYVYLAGDGARYNLTLTNIMNDENITISDYAVTSIRPHASASAPVLNARVNATQISERGNIIIANNEGEINISG